MKNKEKDYIMSTVGCQTIVSLVILGIVFCISKTNSELLSKLSKDLLPLITISLTREEADDAFKDIKEILYSDDLSQSTEGALSESTSDEQNASVSTESQEEETQNQDTESSTEGSVNTDTVTSNLNAVIDDSVKTKNISWSINRDGKEIPVTASTKPYTLNTTIYLPLKGKTTDAFGERIHPVYNTESFHTGIDIAGDTGALIRSIAYGKVIRASYNAWNGNYVEIDHGNGITTMYCHCSALLCKVGTVVSGGEAIAKVGSTGVSTGPHLHFEFRINGVSYNPVYALKYAADEI